MIIGKCPEEEILESYFYKELSFFNRVYIRMHLLFCKRCKDRMEEIKKLDLALSLLNPIPPPWGFENMLLEMADSWAPLNKDSGRKPHGNFRLGAALCAASLALQFIFGDMVSGGVMIFDMGAAWNFMSSGVMKNMYQSVLIAMESDMLSAAKILIFAVPYEMASVILVGGSIMMVLLLKIRSVINGGDT